MNQLHNIKFEYMYRDAGNYKQYGETVFGNPENQSIDSIKNKIAESLIDNEYFDPSVWGIDCIAAYPYDPELDHNWYEFVDVTLSEDELTDDRIIGEFLDMITRSK